MPSTDFRILQSRSKIMHEDVSGNKSTQSVGDVKIVFGGGMLIPGVRRRSENRNLGALYINHSFQVL